VAICLLAVLFLAVLGVAQEVPAQQADAVTVLPDITDDPDTCADTCAPDLPDEDGGQRYKGSIPLRSLGFVPRVTRELLAPEEDEALAWLGQAHLLVAFNPHLLVTRQGTASSGTAMRVIRAVLVDVSTRTVERMVDWRVADRHQFLWVLPGNRVLVHVGSEMRVYGAGLRMEKRMSLAGPLAFARVSPDGKTLALGVVVERHSPELHARLAAAQDGDPEEDVRVTVLDGGFATVASSLSTSGRDPPVLLNEGRVTLDSSPPRPGHTAGRYTLQFLTWDDKARNLGQFQSACTPELSSVAPDLLFLVTCAAFNYAREFRVLRIDGKLVLHGRSNLNEMGHAAESCGRSGTFAIRIFNADAPMLPGEPFHAADLASARLEIYRSQDGKRLFSVRVRDPSASVAGYAVSPYGEVAILAQDGVDVFDMPRSALQELP